MPGCSRLRLVDEPDDRLAVPSSPVRDSIYWIIGIGLVLLLGRHASAPTERRSTCRPRASASRALGRFLRIAFGVHLALRRNPAVPAAMPLGLANEVVATRRSRARRVGCNPLHDARDPSVERASDRARDGHGVDSGRHWPRPYRLERRASAVSPRVAAAGWAALIWLIGNGAGGAFAPAASILFGWPGATLFYFIAALWIALPPGYFAKHFSRFTLRFSRAHSRDRDRSPSSSLGGVLARRQQKCVNGNDAQS